MRPNVLRLIRKQLKLAGLFVNKLIVKEKKRKFRTTKIIHTMTKYAMLLRTLLLGFVVLPSLLSAQKRSFDPVVLFDRNTGNITYVEEEDGYRVPDYSYAGYALSETEIPWVTVKAFVPGQQEDATAAIQAAIDYVSGLPMGADGFRGAVLLDKGEFRLHGSLRLHTSGVVLRGHGSGEGGTKLMGMGKQRDAFVYIEGKDDRKTGIPVNITDRYLPVNASVVTVADPVFFKTGDPVRIHRPSTQEWIDAVGCNEFGGGLYTMTWRPGDKDLFFDRRITKIEGSRITLDAPLTNAIEQEYGGATIMTYDWPGRISRVGVEGIAFESDYDRTNEKDEDHRWFGVVMNHVENAWVRQVLFRHLAGSAVFVQEEASKVTVEDCISEHPVSEIGGFRRYTYYTMGQQVLFQRCSAIYGWHDFAIGQCATGPTAFVNCESLYPYNFSGGVASWATGVLFDVVVIEGGNITMMNRGQDGNGAGWNMVNSTLWNTTAAKIENYRPPTAQNWAMGPWAKYKGDGYWYEIDVNLQPRSLFYAQLNARTGKDYTERARLRPWNPDDQTTAPSIEQAARLIREGYEPAILLHEWIAKAEIPASALEHAGTITPMLTRTAPKPLPVSNPLSVVNGKLVRSGKLITGRPESTRYWNGNMNPSWINSTPAHITRFVPGRVGHGLTDDLDELTTRMKEFNNVYIDHIPGLWYERRRDDHERFLREDADVWAPFFEQPYARSGQGEAWDRLSKYDLTKFNAWYFDRLRQFTELADQKGLLLIDQHYNQHNIIEAGAHWVDYGWRSANNINNTGFPEPVPYAGNKRVYMAEQFYDVTNTYRMDLHRGHIRHHLENYPEKAGVLHSASSEYTGPAHFMEFWLNTVADWQRETGKDVLTLFGATKDVQDSILNVPALAAVVDVIDINYWFYRADGSLYAPKGGQNLAPRQHARLTPPGEASAASVYRAVREYRDRYPGKAVVYRMIGADEYPWAILMAGGSLAGIPRTDVDGFLKAAAEMTPLNAPNSPDWLLGGNDGYIYYRPEGLPEDIQVKSGRYDKTIIDPETGKVESRERISISANGVTRLMPGKVVWLKLRK